MSKYFMITILVNSFQETIDFYSKLDFELDFDNKIDGSDRWIVLKHNNNGSFKLSLKIKNKEQNFIVNQVGDQTLFNLHIEDLHDYCDILDERGLHYEKISSPYAEYIYLKDNNGNKITLSEFWINGWDSC
ncbi:conserved hypothetical protein [Tenacibaculum maritimum]|uniref:VOC family protein n=1 Tax=Tenacibaculum maritimum TaxID=107401 RepID=UPI0012E45AEA|nr:VOC family protein [Tenacibaculum maritimum]CAA0251145.1 conserved hypothetical protein [Tenacibaculum maritimum]